MVFFDEQKESILDRIETFFGEYQTLDSGGSSCWTSGVGICHVLELLLKDNDEICPCSVIPQGEYGLRDLSIGLPVRLGSSGVREIVEIELGDYERTRLHNAEKKIKSLLPKDSASPGGSSA